MSRNRLFGVAVVTALAVGCSSSPATTATDERHDDAASSVGPHDADALVDTRTSPPADALAAGPDAGSDSEAVLDAAARDGAERDAASSDSAWVDAGGTDSGVTPVGDDTSTPVPPPDDVGVDTGPAPDTGSDAGSDPDTGSGVVADTGSIPVADTGSTTPPDTSVDACTDPPATTPTGWSVLDLGPYTVSVPPNVSAPFHPPGRPDTWLWYVLDSAGGTDGDCQVNPDTGYTSLDDAEAQERTYFGGFDGGASTSYRRTTHECRADYVVTKPTDMPLQWDHVMLGGKLVLWGCESHQTDLIAKFAAGFHVK